MVFLQLHKDMSFCLFSTIFKQFDNDYQPKVQNDSGTVAQLINELVKKILEQLFGLAKILLFLLEYEQPPSDTMAHMEKWVNTDEKKEE